MTDFCSPELPGASAPGPSAARPNPSPTAGVQPPLRGLPGSAPPVAAPPPLPLPTPTPRPLVQPASQPAVQPPAVFTPPVVVSSSAASRSGNQPSAVRTGGLAASPARPKPLTPADWVRLQAEERFAEQPIVPLAPVAINTAPPEPTDPVRQRLSARMPAWLANTPPWMISWFVHLVIILIMALWVYNQNRREQLELELSWAEQIGNQLIDNSIQMATEEPQDQPPVLAETEEPEVEAPQAAPQPQPAPEAPVYRTEEIVLPQVGMSLEGRESGSKKSLLDTYGGNASTEEAVDQALAWLARQQRRRGQWSLIGPYSDAGTDENEVAATAMAMLAFQGAGYTPEVGPYRRQMGKARAWLLASQDSDGSFWKGQGVNNHRLYTHALATMAICELYGMSRDAKLRRPAQKALDYCVATQASLGGWRYEPGEDSDTSVTGWFVMALQSGRMAGLHVPSPTLMKIHEFLDRVAHNDGSRYSYTTYEPPTLSMTAEGLLCRQYLGWARNDERLLHGVDYLLDHPVSDEPSQMNAYYWYYATQVLHHVEGDAWNEWNQVMRQKLPEMQIKKGKEAGSWDPADHPYGMHAGRLFITCLHTYMLEVYYRHLPLYRAIQQQ